jgi:hypothetical protein
MNYIFSSLGVSMRIVTIAAAFVWFSHHVAIAQTAACPEGNPSACGNGYDNGPNSNPSRYGSGGGGGSKAQCYDRCSPIYARCMNAGNVSATCGAYLQQCQSRC